jgi:hypothetical protein
MRRSIFAGVRETRNNAQTGGRDGRARPGRDPGFVAPSSRALRDATRTILIVFVAVVDPVASGFGGVGAAGRKRSPGFTCSITA